MKLPCEMVQDLLPLYHDGVCSEVSSTLVGEHLADCEDCTRMLKNIDAEIEVPKMEVEKAEPLGSINVKWNQQKRKTLLKCITAGVMAFALFVGCWWVLFKWYCIPVAPEEIAVFSVCELENGSIFIETDVPYRDYYPYIHVTEEGVLYDWNKRPLSGGKLEPRRSGWFSFDPETDTWRDENGNSVLLTAYCLGEPGSEDVIVLWEKGMELPAAGEREEAEYKHLLEAFEAPNAPEKPTPLSVEHVEVESIQELSDNIYETVVSGTDSTESAE